MKKIVVASIALALVGFLTSAHAGDAEAGKAKSAACAGCHGADGNSMVPTYPKLAGQHEAYLVKAMADYKTGARTDATMQAMMAPLSDADLENIAAFYASQTPK